MNNWIIYSFKWTLHPLFFCSIKCSLVAFAPLLPGSSRPEPFIHFYFSGAAGGGASNKLVPLPKHRERRTEWNRLCLPRGVSVHVSRWTLKIISPNLSFFTSSLLLHFLWLRAQITSASNKHSVCSYSVLVISKWEIGWNCVVCVSVCWREWGTEVFRCVCMATGTFMCVHTSVRFIISWEIWRWKMWLRLMMSLTQQRDDQPGEEENQGEGRKMMIPVEGDVFVFHQLALLQLRIFHQNQENLCHEHTQTPTLGLLFLSSD